MENEKREAMSQEEFSSKVGELLRQLEEKEANISKFEPENIRK